MRVETLPMSPPSDAMCPRMTTMLGSGSPLAAFSLSSLIWVLASKRLMMRFASRRPRSTE